MSADLNLVGFRQSPELNDFFLSILYMDCLSNHTPFILR